METCLKDIVDLKQFALAAYNSKPGIELSEEARMTIFVRLGSEQQPTLSGAP